MNEPGADDGGPAAPWECGLPDEGTDPETLAAITALYASTPGGAYGRR